ncbi:hypothetical protein PISMIDRAFT_679187 [Pisolithus microcarpus 441]|uniref:Uncharacterized protein n=1 Tax=Pisolithus microcarpus 441 TaxID=765257 RepID=A0A0C9ZMC4_9AGAM|nr:hypothetical protein BKA83DRAFT_679187 [Pisolithus microcarpus]KIK23487.1 hypothetical protein PISMIDRAFT_679187 [Pisolithus microcarpus 441]
MVHWTSRSRVFGTDLRRKHTSSRPVIPKRGERDFEPAHRHGSDLQLHVFDRVRGTMFETLRAERGISSYGGITRVHVVTSCGVHFTSIGVGFSCVRNFWEHGIRVGRESQDCETPRISPRRSHWPDRV